MTSTELLIQMNDFFICMSSLLVDKTSSKRAQLIQLYMFAYCYVPLASLYNINVN